MKDLAIKVNGFDLYLHIGDAFESSFIRLWAQSEWYLDGFDNAVKEAMELLPYHVAIHAIEQRGVQMLRDVAKTPSISEDFDIDATIAAYESMGVEVDHEVYNLALSIRDYHIKHRPLKSLRSGYVYLLQSVSGHYKIGRTVNPQNRLKTFGVLLPFEVEFIALIKSDDCVSLERSLHQTFRDFRVNGEWFNLAPDDVEYIKGLAKEAQNG